MDKCTEAVSTGDGDWDTLRLFCNLVLRWGIERDQKERMKIMEECRVYRYKRGKRLMVDEARRDG